MTQSRILIQLFAERGGRYQAINSYGLDELGGQVPTVGDLILEPGVAEGKDRNDPSNRDLYLVKTRYFEPGATDSDPMCISLLVELRQGRQEEVNILN